MNTPAKVAIAGCLIVVALGVAGVVGVIWYVGAHHGELIASAQHSRNEGAEFGKGAGESQCVTEAMTQHRGNRSIIGSVRTTLWLGGCLDASKVEADFCTDVPPESEFTRTVTWRVSRCAAAGFAGDSSCPNLLSEVQRYCHGSKRAKKVGPS